MPHEQAPGARDAIGRTATAGRGATTSLFRASSFTRAIPGPTRRGRDPPRALTRQVMPHLPASIVAYVDKASPSTPDRWPFGHHMRAAPDRDFEAALGCSVMRSPSGPARAVADWSSRHDHARAASKALPGGRGVRKRCSKGPAVLLRTLTLTFLLLDDLSPSGSAGSLTW